MKEQIKKIAEGIIYIGVDDLDIDLFESQYIVPNGMSYNSYLIEDEKIAVMDSADSRKGDEWFANLEAALAGRQPDYLIVQHMEPDHTGSIKRMVESFPEMKLVATAKALKMLPQFFSEVDFSERTIAVNEGDTLSLGVHTLHFFTAAMVHWPEVMVTWESHTKTLFSADGFGKFGALSRDEDWACEARRYYFNICGKYGAPVQALLRKAAALEISTICPLHGPVLSENLEYYINLYKTWSNYDVETEGVLVACASIHGGTLVAAQHIADELRRRGAGRVELMDLTRCDMAEAVEEAFRVGKMILAASSYDGGVFTPMHNFLHLLQMKGYQRRRVGVVENGSWAPSAAKVMLKMLQEMKGLEIVEPVVTICSRFKPCDREQVEQLIEATLK